MLDIYRLQTKYGDLFVTRGISSTTIFIKRLDFEILPLLI